MNTFTRISNYEELNIIGTGMYKLYYQVLKRASIADQTDLREKQKKTEIIKEKNMVPSSEMLCTAESGSRIVDYNLCMCVYAGAYGTVYKARDLKNPGKIVALKK